MSFLKVITGIDLILRIYERYRAARRAPADPAPAGNDVDAELIGGAEALREENMSAADFYDAIERQLIRDEGMRQKPYRDTVGKLTIGVGRNLDDNGISEREAMHMLRNDVLIAESEVSTLACYRDLSAPRRAVLINMAFNLGMPGLLGFRNMIAALNVRDFARAADEMLASKWAGQVGDRSRRLSEQMRRGEWIS